MHEVDEDEARVKRATRWEIQGEWSYGFGINLLIKF